MKRFNDFAKMIQRMISLALEFFKFAVMRRPDHKFRDQWRKADSALQPPSSYFGHIFWLHVLLLSSFSLQNDPLPFRYIGIYLLNISLCVSVYYHDFRSVIVLIFLLHLYKLYLYLLSLYFPCVLTFASFLSLDRLWSIAPVFQDLIAHESTGEEIFFIQSTTW